MSRTTRSTAKTEEIARTTTRRSARLNKLRKSEIQSQESNLLRRRIVKEPPESRESAAVCAEEPTETKPLLTLCRTTPLDLDQRERALSMKEQELKRKLDELDGRLSNMAEKEEHASFLISQLAHREARATLSQLEEHFTCALCYDIMACPMSLNPGQCGHTFCALCVLKWFFSRLHKACGGWHESVDCPICRSLLIITPDRLPRPDTTFPFTPNRTVDTVVRDLVGKLADFPSFDALADDGSKGVKKMEEDLEMLTQWRMGGDMRAEWLRRDLAGREEISEITKKWKNMNSKDFVDFKTKLGV